MQFGGRKRGFSLIEAVATLAVLGVISTTALAALATTLAAVRRGRATVDAATLAEWRLGHAMLLDNEALLTYMAADSSAAFAAPFSAYRWNLSVRTLPQRPHLFDLQVDVKGMGAAYELRTLVFRPPGSAP